MTTTVLYIAHNHPVDRPGGAEIYAHALFEAMCAREGFDAYFVAKGGPPLGYSSRQHFGTYFAPAGGHPNDYLVYTDGYVYDWLNGTITDKEFYNKHFTNFLTAIRPDVVHVQHTNYLGYDLLRAIRNALPHTAIAYTLHEYGAICHRDGQMLRTIDNQPCRESSPRRCHECFPHVTPQQFFLRRRFVQSHLALVDHFVAPSRFLLERYVDWGVPRERILYEEYGRTLPPPLAEDEPRTTRNRFAFFGQANPYKGLDVLLEAFRQIEADRRPGGGDTLLSLVTRAANGDHRAGPEPHLDVHGANLEVQPREHQDRINALVDAAGPTVTWAGRYRAEQLPVLMAGIDWVVVPSIWWENSPLVIQEAFHYGRPVICSDIGCMAEKVRDGVDGLHFRAADPKDLAAVVRRAASTPGLWEQLRSAIRPVHPMDGHVDALAGLYAQLLAGRRAGAMADAR